MNKVMIYLKSMLRIVVGIIILTIISTIFHYYNIFSNSLMDIIKLLIPIISILYGSIYLGKKSNKKGYLEGVKLSLILIFFFVLISIIFFDSDLSIKSILYYIIFIITSITGSIIGIQKKGN